MNNELTNKRLREYRARTGNAATKKYEKSIAGKLMRSYRNIVSRVSGVQAKKHHLYKGKDVLSKQDFYDWSLNNKDFYRLYEDWCASGFDRKLSPSVDRIDTSKGYTIDNMRWITHSENSRLGGMYKKHNE
jgi:hypothetical protein